ncbi:sigma-70 family RNA polymerase sigma factor [Flavobacteriaceae bacterium XHP0103]|uniref:sigma-70 family RNA polymerase sigma factor n=1 Tax=Marixanthotalea marina TaxID=2844359 RepID=UPI002989E129|nr:sigma-70 family RNA polymerase sigma factor [Marixanthotalea marina]MBU3821079.1 sigma-70 family RNA polymerase sigma factor [Marixanthotalea marina]
MEKEQLWNVFEDEVYFFILKKVRNSEAAKDILQTVFLKVHYYHETLKDAQKLRPWVFQIARNEIANYYKHETRYVEIQNEEKQGFVEAYEDVCCLSFFMNNLPSPYKEAINLVYVEGMKQHEAAEDLGISLANVKARVRRGKMMLVKKLKECCQYEIDENGKLIGEADCPRCSM